MELFGEKLKEARETKGYSIEQIARETKISKHFIVALENEEFSTFPSETYLVGFLKNYADFLALDPDRLVTLYRNFKIQEQPIPMDELLNMKKKVSPLIIVVASILGLAVIAGIVFVLVTFVFNSKQSVETTELANDQVVPEVPIRQSREEYLFKEEIVTRVFQEGDLIRFPIKDKEIVFKIDAISDTLKLDYDNQQLTLALAEEKYLDLDKDNQYDLKITFVDVGDIENGRDAKMMLEKITISMAAAEDTVSNIAVPDAQNVSNLSHEKYKLKNDAIVVAEAPQVKNFEINIKFQNYCLFRYLIDNNLQEQRYFYKDDPLKIPVNREAVLWMSNADAVSLNISGVDAKLGKPGEVQTKLVHWVQDSQTGNYKLEIVSIY